MLFNAGLFWLSHDSAAFLSRYSNSHVGVAAGEYRRLVTYAFVHAGALHLAVNLLSLAVAGYDLELMLGKVRFLANYLFAAVGGGIVSLFLGPSTSYGASGAIFGVIGMLLVIRQKRRVGNRFLLAVVVANLGVGLVLHADTACHLGGFATGLVLGETYTWSARRKRTLLSESCALAVIVLFLSGLVIMRVHSFSVDPDLKAVLETQVHSLEKLGLPYDNLIAQQVMITPRYRASISGSAVYAVYVLKDPHRNRTIRLEFGDGKSSTVSVPKGRGVFAHAFSHNFSRVPGRYRQAVTQDDPNASTGDAITDVCPSRAQRAMRPIGELGEKDPPFCAQT